MITRRILCLSTPCRRFLASSAAAAPNTSTPSSQTAKKWDISVGVALIRLPVIAPPMTDVEKKYDEVMRAEEHENSLMSDFELQTIKDQE